MSAMDTTTITVIAGVLGSLVGASATIGGAWVNQRTQHKRELIRADIDKCETLYGDFIGECSRLMIDAYGHTLESPEMLLTAYALLNRIRLSSSKAVLKEAEQIMSLIANQYFSPNLLLEDMRELALSPGKDPLKPFGEVCRAELKKKRTGM